MPYNTVVGYNILQCRHTFIYSRRTDQNHW